MTVGRGLLLTPLIFAFWGFLNLDDSPLPDSLIGFLGLAGSFVCLSVIGMLVVDFGRRFAPNSALERLHADDRPPIVYLRPFSEDSRSRSDHDLKNPDDYGQIGNIVLGKLFPSMDRTRSLLKAYWGSVERTLEEEIVSYFTFYGPVIAIGRPGEGLMTPGAARMYVSDEDWQGEVLELLRRSQFVVWHAGMTDGTLWELYRIVDEVDPERVVLIVPDPALRPEAWETVRTVINQSLPRPVERTWEPLNLVGFDSDWAPQLRRFVSQDAIGTLLSVSTLDLHESLDSLTTALRRTGSELGRQRSLFDWCNLLAGLLLPVLIALLLINIRFHEESCAPFEAGAHAWQSVATRGDWNPGDLRKAFENTVEGLESGLGLTCPDSWTLPAQDVARARVVELSSLQLEAWAQRLGEWSLARDDIEQLLERLADPALDARWLQLRAEQMSLMRRNRVLVEIRDDAVDYQGLMSVFFDLPGSLFPALRDLSGGTVPVDLRWARHQLDDEELPPDLVLTLATAEKPAPSTAAGLEAMIQMDLLLESDCRPDQPLRLSLEHGLDKTAETRHDPCGLRVDGRRVRVIQSLFSAMAKALEDFDDRRVSRCLNSRRLTR